ncbi:MAG: hypothetical protein ACRC2R_21875 [Xenococcaceae cyanobacterium]
MGYINPGRDAIYRVSTLFWCDRHSTKLKTNIDLGRDAKFRVSTLFWCDRHKSLT